MPLPDHARQARSADQVHEENERGKHRLAAAPTPAFLGPANRPRLDRFVTEEPAEFGGEFTGGGVTLIRILLEALEANCVQVAGDAGV